MKNASTYKNISKQRPSAYRNINSNLNENSLLPEEEGGTANFGAMMEFHHQPQQNFFKMNPTNGPSGGLANRNGLQIGRLAVQRDSFHQSGAMSDGGNAGHGRQYRSNSHTNLDPNSLLSPIAPANNNMITGFNDNGLNMPQSQAKTQDRRFDRLGPAQFDQYNPGNQQNQYASFIQRRHKTPNELSSGTGHQGASMMMATPMKSSINITAKSKFSE